MSQSQLTEPQQRSLAAIQGDLQAWIDSKPFANVDGWSPWVGLPPTESVAVRAFYETGRVREIQVESWRVVKGH